jgi:NADH:ubiquinone oxidoreductase subunit E/NAD-dependent dihydropyrimidine dehydrogenase PreA subunit
MSPKLVECGRHVNIEKLTYSEVEEITGEPGNFSVKVRKKARSIDMDKCTGCGVCTSVCPVRFNVNVPHIQEIEEDETVIRADEIIDRYEGKRQFMIQMLQDSNAEFNYLPEKVLKRISSRLDVPYAEVYGTASFYKAFSLEPRGEHIIQVCMGTACHVRGAARVLDEIARELGLEEEGTTDDMKFTVETVNCLGACALAPVIAVDGVFHGQMTPGKVGNMLDSALTGTGKDE